IYIMWDKIDRVTLIYVGSFLSSIFTTLVSLSFSSGVPKFFGRDWMLKANSLSQIINSLAKIMGPFLGGLVYGFGKIEYFILFNGVSFLISMAIEIFLEVDNTKEKVEENKYKMRDGVDYLKENRELRIFTLKFALINFAAITAIVIPVPYIVNQVLHLQNLNLGMIQGALPMGAIIGAISVNKGKMTLNKKSFINIFAIFLITCIILYCSSFEVAKNAKITGMILGTAMFIGGTAFGILDVTAVTYFQKKIPENIRGKIVGIITGVVKFTMPLAFVLSGKIIDLYSPFISIIVGGSIILIALIYFYTNLKVEESLEEIVVGDHN
ncbi:MAG: MFS transporter, partial [Fusobacteriaceae bacterium]